MLGNIKNFLCLTILLCVASMSAASAFGQDKKPPKDPPTRERTPMPGPKPPGFSDRGEGETMERSAPVDPNVTVKLCVSEGNLKINGWRRNEVRVFVRNGRRFNMKPQEKSAESGRINWLWVVHAPATPARASECLTGERIEIDAPIGSSFDLSGRSARMWVDSVKKVKIKIIEGPISLRNITGGINAYTSQGDIMVDNSAGGIALENTVGNIIAIDVKPGQIGELLRAKSSSGAITMQRVEHRQIEANSVSGSLLFDGKFLTGGIYNFRTSNGSIKLAIPAASSCTFKAIYGAGHFESEMPMTIISEDGGPRLKTVVAKMGTGDAMVTLTTSTGSIGIRRAAGAAKP